MAKKARTPPPPRQQGPKKRDTTLPSRRSPRSAAISGVLVGVAIVVAVILFMSLRNKSSSNDSITPPTAAMAAAGCTLKSVPPLPPTAGKTASYHEDSPTLTSKVKWSTDPPSAGGHYPLWAVWGFYDTPVNPRRVVHNEEHGGMIIWWGDKVPDSTVAKLRAFYDESPAGMVGTPYPTLGNKIALTAWTGDPVKYNQRQDNGMGHIAICPTFDEKGFKAFRDAYRGKGPEGIPLSADQPGTGPTS